MICITSEKCSIINLDTLKIIFCEIDYDEMSLTASCKELNYEVISIAGVSGGGLRNLTDSGEILSATYPEYPMCKIIYTSNYKNYILESEMASCVYEDYEVKAFGFSSCNNYFVIVATDLAIFKRI